jgi:ligand-binding sensor domain-containing protein
MKYLLRISLLSFFLSAFSTSFPQQFSVGQWRDQLPYSKCISIAEAGNRVYCATPYSLFYFDKEDNSVQRINKINGLSDIGINVISYSSATNTLVVGYTNANIDLIRNQTIINISDIKRSTILGNKTINNIYILGNYAYLCCSFGIVVLDIDKEEIHDTYYIGANGGHVNVLGLTKDDNDSLFAASDNGIYLASLNNPNLVNFENWRKDDRIDPNGKYSSITTFAGEVVVNKRTVTSVDTVYRFSNSQWSPWVINTNDRISNLRNCYNLLMVVFNYSVKYYNPDFTENTGIYGYDTGGAFPLDAIMDKGQTVWIADNYFGLVSFKPSTGVYNHINLGGPLTGTVFFMTTSGNHLYVVPGGRDDSYTPLYFAGGGQIYHFDDNNWTNYTGSSTPTLNLFHDLVTVAVDPTDPGRIFAGSWGRGLVELYNGNIVASYSESNSSLRHHTASDTSDIRVSGTGFDQDGNLWVVCTHNNQCLSRKSGSTWTGYNLSTINQADLGKLLVTKSGQKWIQMRITNSNTNSVIVFTDNGTPENPADDQYRMLNSTENHGKIPGLSVFAMVEDKNGQVWVGTEKGIGVFYTPENIFTGENFDAQQVLVQQGLYVQYLMENEMVTALAIDGANRKWIGTDRGGLYLFSEDGTQQIYHFTEENSALFSNRITSLAINPTTGEVFVGTDKGIISFKGTATEGTEEFGNVYAYPNPVREGFDGWIAIKGLVTNAQVRITDIGGDLIFSTKAEGGQAVWDGRNFNGKKAKTGVYLVYASSEKGEEKIVTKILVIN